MTEEPKKRRRARPLPWSRIARALTLAFDARKIALGCAAMIVIQAGAVALNRFAPSESSVAPDVLGLDRIGPASLSGVQLEPMFRHALWEVAEPARLLIGPMLRLFAIDAGVLGSAHAALRLLLAVVVLGVVGGAVSRSAACEVGLGRRPPIAECLGFAGRSAWPLIGPALFPIGAALACGLACAVLGALYRLPILGAPLAGLTFFAPLALGVVMAILLIDLAAAWPLTHASVAVDAESTLDALSRAFGYVNRRPVRFAACAAIAWLAGAVGLLAFDAMLRIAVHLAAWGLNATTSPEIVAGLVRPDRDARSLDTLAGTVPFFWTRIIKTLVHAWVYAYFWSAATVVYFALRQDVDGEPWTNVKDQADAML
jgi:hypothetical protein